MKRLFGNTTGLKPSQIGRLENLYRRRIPQDAVISQPLVRDLAALSFEIHRQLGLLINRSGQVAFVIVGSPDGIVIPDTREYRLAPGRLRGLRCVHTHLSDQLLSREDLTDLALLRLDMMAAVTLDADGYVLRVHVAHIFPGGGDNQPHRVLAPLSVSDLDIGCREMIRALEAELEHVRPARKAGTAVEQALLVSVFTRDRRSAKDSIRELQALARSAGIVVVDTILQQRRHVDPRFVVGKGKLMELLIPALQKGVTMLVFDQELSPSQIRSITDVAELKVIDRTQLILDIFAQRARTREGRLQVELAQLKYLRSRLVTKNTAMSRLTGGIGGRGPGETEAGDQSTARPRSDFAAGNTDRPGSDASTAAAGPTSPPRRADNFHRRLYQCGQIHPFKHVDPKSGSGREASVRHVGPGQSPDSDSQGISK